MKFRRMKPTLFYCSEAHGMDVCVLMHVGSGSSTRFTVYIVVQKKLGPPIPL